jgi:hypothetical protein
MEYTPYVIALIKSGLKEVGYLTMLSVSKLYHFDGITNVEQLLE